MKSKSIKGESILELTIILGLIVIVISAVAFATVNGLRNSQFSKNQLQATKLAQELIEGVRTIRDRDYTVCGPSTIKLWSDLWTNPSCSGVGPCKYILKSSGICPATGTSDPFWLEPTAAAVETTVGGAAFKKIILISDFGGARQKQVSAQVFWSDASGEHKSEIVTVIADVR